MSPGGAILASENSDSRFFLAFLVLLLSDFHHAVKLDLDITSGERARGIIQVHTEVAIAADNHDMLRSVVSLEHVDGILWNSHSTKGARVLPHTERNGLLYSVRLKGMRVNKILELKKTSNKIGGAASL